MAGNQGSDDTAGRVTNLVDYPSKKALNELLQATALLHQLEAEQRDLAGRIRWVQVQVAKRGRLFAEAVNSKIRSNQS